MENLQTLLESSVEWTSQQEKAKKLAEKWKKVVC